MKEIWRDVPGYKKYYQVSNLARVKSLKRVRPNGGVLKEKIRKITLGNDGKMAIFLNKFGSRKRFLLHHLVLLTFKGPCPKGMEGCHNDGDSSNNNFSNLRWDTHKNNQADMIKHGTTRKGKVHSKETRKKMRDNHCDIRGVKNPRSKLTLKQVSKIRSKYANGKFSYGDLAKIFNISKSSIGRVVHYAVYSG